MLPCSPSAVDCALPEAKEESSFDDLSNPIVEYK